MSIKLGLTVDMPHKYAHAHFDDLDLDARSQSLGRGKHSALNYLDN